MIDRPHFAFPFTRGADGRVRCVEQDSDEHVMSCVNVIVRCPAGFRLDRPDFGIPWPEYRTTFDASELDAAVSRLEPRSTLSAYELTDVADRARREFVIEVKSNG
jgi:phage baseplate assembly protein W